MNRFNASLIHLFGSAAVLFLIFVLVRFVWYPEPFFSSASGINLMKILVPIDLVIGPLITLIIFNPKKASLKFDMAFVLACQIVFLCYGFWTIYSARPVYVAFDEDWFRLVAANEIDPKDQAKAKYSAFRSLPLLGPQIIGTMMPVDPEKRAQLVVASVSGMGVQNLPEYYVPYNNVMPIAKSVAKSAKDLKFLTDDERQRALSFELKMTEQGRQVLFIPMHTKAKLLFVAVDPLNGKVIEIL